MPILNNKNALRDSGARFRLPPADPGRTESNMDEKILPGKYRHFKGGEYEVLFVATHSETLEEYVVYRALYGENKIWVRPAAMWNETVERDGKCFPRFRKIDD